MVEKIKIKRDTHRVSLRTPAGVRTLDPLIKSQMLYQLSYKRVCICYFSNACAKVGVLF